MRILRRLGRLFQIFAAMAHGAAMAGRAAYLGHPALVAPSPRRDSDVAIAELRTIFGIGAGVPLPPRADIAEQHVESYARMVAFALLRGGFIAGPLVEAGPAAIAEARAAVRVFHGQPIDGPLDVDQGYW